MIKIEFFSFINDKLSQIKKRTIISYDIKKCFTYLPVTGGDLRKPSNLIKNEKEQKNVNFFFFLDFLVHIV